MQLIPINFKDDNHRHAISKLAKRNEFCESDLNFLLGLPVHPVLDAVLKSQGLEVPLFADGDYGGFLLINTEKEAGKKKVAGFIIGGTPDDKLCLIHFLLVDRAFRNRGFGKDMVWTYMRQQLYNGFLFLVVKDASNPDYWKKNFGFVDDPVFKSSLPGHARLVHSTFGKLQRVEEKGDKLKHEGKRGAEQGVSLQQSDQGHSPSNEK